MQTLVSISSKKRPGQQQVSDVNAVAGQNGFLLHVTDKLTNTKWLVDGGAVVSIIPPTAAQRSRGPNGVGLRAANGTSIHCYGESSQTIQIGDQQFTYSFTVADVKQRIIGADFLAEFYLAPNHRDAQLLSLQDLSTLPAEHASGATSSHINFVSQLEDPCYKLLDSYPEITTPSFKIKDPKHGVRHHIPTSDGPPIQSRARRLDPEKLSVAKAELEKLVELGICYRGKSEWSSPLLVTTKPNGGWRVCGDYRRVNARTVDDRYPVRTLQDFTSELQGKSIFSKIDLMKGYHQIPVADDDVRKTAVITPFGLFVFPRTPFGLKNAGQDFQRLMDEILGEVPRIFVYIDDILVASESLDQHLQDLKTVFEALAENGLVVQRSKCLLGQSELEFLGYQVSSEGIAPLPDRVEAIRKTSVPTSIKELQRFLGMVGYYRRFIPNAANHLYHLFEALKGPKDKKVKTLTWTPDMQNSFDATKEALASAALLHHPRPGATLALTTDASDKAIGGVLEQRGPKGWEPLAFYSSKLEKNQQSWPPYDRELLAAFKGTRHFRDFIEGRSFTLYTDHQSLVPSVHKKTDPQTIRQQYQLSCIAEYTTDIRYLQGKANVVADALSRPNDEETEVNGVNAVSIQEGGSPALRQPQRQSTNEPNRPRSFTTRSSNNSASSAPSITFSTPTHANAIDNREKETTTSSGLSLGTQERDPKSALTHVASHSPSFPFSASTRIDAEPLDRIGPDFLDQQPQTVPPPPPNDPHLREQQLPNIAANDIENRSTCSSKRAEAISNLQQVVASIGDLGVDWNEVAIQQPLDPEFQRLKNDTQSGLNWKSIDIGQRQLLVDISNGPARPYIPFALRRNLFNVLHGLGHPGVERTRQMVAAKVIWPSMREDCSRWARECLQCQQAKVTRHVTPPIGEFIVPNRRFEHLNIDLVTLPRSNGFKYLLTAVDRFTRWPIAIPLVDISAQSVAEAFTYGWVAHFGVPATVTTDRGSQFSSATFQQLTKIWGIKVQMTTPYHPEANGLVERLHRRLKEALVALGAEHPDEWFWKLPCVLLSIRTTFKPDIGASPADLVYGEGLAVPGEILSNTPSTEPQLARQREAALADLRLEVARFQPSQTSAHRRPQIHLPEDLNTCTHVFVRRGGVTSTLSSPYLGPYRVITRNATNFRIAIPGRSAETVAVCRVKPAHMANDADAEPEVPTPPRPGRRPGPRTRPPAQADRQTRSQRQNSQPQVAADARDPSPPPSPVHPSPSRFPSTSTSGHGGAAAPSTSAPRRQGPRSWADIVSGEGQGPDLFEEGEAPDAPSTPTPASTPSDPAPEPEVLPAPPQRVKKTLSFSNPQKGHFSYRRRPDVNALSALIHEHLGVTSTSPNSVS